jgi:hypothetical protein
MSEKQKKRKNEEVMEVGRTLGALSKTDEEIWAAIERQAYLEGKKKHDVIAEMVAQALIMREVVQKGLTMEQLLAAWELKDRIESMLFKKVMMLGTTFFGTLLQEVGNLVTGISQYQQEQLQQVVEEEKKKDIEFQIKKTRAQMASKMLEAMMPMLTSMLSATMKTMSATQLIPQTQVKEEKKQETGGVEVIDD